MSAGIASGGCNTFCARSGYSPAPHSSFPIVVSAMFMSVITQVNLTAIVAPLFITTMGMLMLASISFLLEVRLASDFVQRKF